jgi:L-alanine-DL-glutamate epimerase-like enolase superfamily enzyme
MTQSSIVDFRVTRFEFARDRVIGDSQIRVDDVQAAAIELIDEQGEVGLGFINPVLGGLPAEDEIARLFSLEAWPNLRSEFPAALAHRRQKNRGGARRAASLGLDEAVQQAVWDLYAKSADMPLWRLLGGKARKVRVYASGLDFHLCDEEYSRFFASAAEDGHSAFKIKVGHPDVERDIHRLDLLKKAVGAGAIVMVDANEAWTPKDAVRALESYRHAGHDIYWVEDPILRSDLEGLKHLREAFGPTYLNSGEYLDYSGKRALITAGAADVINIGCRPSEAMHLGYCASDENIELALGNSILEMGVNLAIAIPEVRWLEYSYQNLGHLVEAPFVIRDGWIEGSEAPGHGLILSEKARRTARVPHPKDPDRKQCLNR